MKKESKPQNENCKISRRNFLKVSGAAVAGSTLTMCSGTKEKEAKIRQYRTLGRTGFKVSDIAMGGTRNQDSNVVRYAYDQGINYFDTGETYVRGKSESIIGEALQFMDRKKIFITTKIHLNDKDTEETVLDRFRKCQERLKTDYIDAFDMHGVPDIATLSHKGFHSAVNKLKAEGRVKFIGLSCHGPGRTEGNSMEEVLCAAAEDGRFDIVLFIYNFMNKEAGEKILAACKKKNIGTTAMKTSPGVLKVTPFDPDNPTERQARSMDRMKSRGMSEEQITERMKQSVKRQEEAHEKTKPFIDKYHIETEDQLRKASIHWVINNPDMHTACVSFSDFDLIDKIVPLSGTKLSRAEADFLEKYKLAFNNQYCRHACTTCVDKCAHKLPVSTIMRYSYYFETQGREKYAMSKYASLKGQNGALCLDCDAPCNGACPHGVNIQSNLLAAHSILTLA
jgi:predicted aldo/keto reductase-like oxidoreductase